MQNIKNNSMLSASAQITQRVIWVVEPIKLHALNTGLFFL
jgi:hypothetical protein